MFTWIRWREDLAERASGDGVSQQPIARAVRAEENDVDGFAKLVQLHHDPGAAAEVAVSGSEQRPVQRGEHPGDEPMPRTAERGCADRAGRRCAGSAGRPRSAIDQPVAEFPRQLVDQHAFPLGGAGRVDEAPVAFVERECVPAGDVP